MGSRLRCRKKSPLLPRSAGSATVSRPAPMQRAAAISIFPGASRGSFSVFLQKFLHVQTPAAFLEPHVRLLIDSALGQRLLDIFTRRIQRRRLLIMYFYQEAVVP